MKIVVIGLGIQGKKRIKFLKKELVATVDPFNKKADYRDIKDINLKKFNTVFICTPDDEKYKIIYYCLKNKKNVLVEKPLWTSNLGKIKFLEKLAIKNKVKLYVAYNHRFEPHFLEMKKLISSKKLGKIYSCRMFYGNGTAKLIKNNSWRNKGSGVLTDLGSHLLDICKMWFGNNLGKFKLISANKFENSSFDHAAISNNSKRFWIELEMTYCMWRNHFTCDVLGEKGSAHIESLCKWGPSKFTYRKRVFPSGLPIEKKKVIKRKDNTWKDEYTYFKTLVDKKDKTNLTNDLWIYSEISKIFNKAQKST